MFWNVKSSVSSVSVYYQPSDTGVGVCVMRAVLATDASMGRHGAVASTLPPAAVQSPPTMPPMPHMPPKKRYLMENPQRPGGLIQLAEVRWGTLLRSRARLAGSVCCMSLWWCLQSWGLSRFCAPNADVMLRVLISCELYVCEVPSRDVDLLILPCLRR